MVIAMDVRCFFASFECPVLSRLIEEYNKLTTSQIGDLTLIDVRLKIYGLVANFCRSCKLLESQPKIGMLTSEEVGAELEINDALKTLSEKYGDYVDVRDVGGDYYIVPKKYLGKLWKEINNIVIKVGGEWVKESNPADSYWVIKTSSK